MSLIVYGAPLSPFVRKLRVFLAEKGLAYQLQIITPFGQPQWFREISPLGRIPAIKDAELAMADSSVICQYLEEKHPELPPLYGQNALQRAQIRWLEKYADYELAPLTTFTVFRNRVLKPTMNQACDEAAVQNALHDKLPPHFDYLEQTLGTGEYFVADSLSMADLAFACQLINLEHAGEHLDNQRWPALAGLLQRIKARTCMIEILPSEQRTLTKLSGKS